MASWLHSLLALAALALGVLLSGCASWSSDTKIDPNTVPWVNSRVFDPPAVGPSFFSPSGKGLQESAGNGLY